MRLRRREDRRTEFRDHRVEDLPLALATGDAPGHLGLQLVRERRVRLVERRVALNADEFRLEAGLARARRAREGRGRERERRDSDRHRLHDRSAR